MLWEARRWNTPEQPMLAEARGRVQAAATDLRPDRTWARLHINAPLIMYSTVLWCNVFSCQRGPSA
jgi:hypothetical protein